MTKIFHIAIVLLLLSTACTQPPPPDTRAADESALREADTQWSKSATARDIEGIVAFYTDDAALMPPNAPITTGKEAIRASWAQLLSPGFSLTWQPNKVEVAGSGDLGYSMGIYQLTMKDPKGKDVADRGKYVEIWKKQADGKWKAVSDMFNSDLPAPSEKKK